MLLLLMRMSLTINVACSISASDMTLIDLLFNNEISVERDKFNTEIADCFTLRSLLKKYNGKILKKQSSAFIKSLCHSHPDQLPWTIQSFWFPSNVK